MNLGVPHKFQSAYRPQSTKPIEFHRFLYFLKFSLRAEPGIDVAVRPDRRPGRLFRRQLAGAVRSGASDPPPRRTVRRRPAVRRPAGAELRSRYSARPHRPLQSRQRLGGRALHRRCQRHGPSLVVVHFCTKLTEFDSFFLDFRSVPS